MRRLLAAATAVVFAVLATTAPSAAQAVEEPRVIARKLDTGDIELGIRLSNGRDLLPEARFFDYPNVVVGDWYETSPVNASTSVGTAELVVLVRRTAAGRVEVDLDSFTEGVDIWVPSHYSFRYDTAPIGQWLRSAPAVVASNESDMLEIEPSEPAVEPAAPLWPPPAPQRPEPWPPPASSFWPAGTCALGPPHNPGGDILYCTAPTGNQTLRGYLDEFLDMVTPWYPWIGAALEWTGGYTIINHANTPCPTKTSPGCYRQRGRDGTVYIVAEMQTSMPQAQWGEVLIHELAHVFDHMRWFAHNAYPSEQSLTWYDETDRRELFADALAANTMGEAAFSIRYTGTGGIPSQPALRDLHAVGDAVIEWCSLTNCGTPRLAAEVIWAPLRQAAPQQSAVGNPHPTETDTNIECLTRRHELRLGYTRAQGAYVSAAQKAGFARLDAQVARRLADATEHHPHVVEAERLEAEWDRLRAEAERLKAERDRALREWTSVRC